MEDLENRFMNRKITLVSVRLLEFSDRKVRKLMCASNEHLKSQKDEKSNGYCKDLRPEEYAVNRRTFPASNDI